MGSRLVIVDGVGDAAHRWSAALEALSPEVFASLDVLAELGPEDVAIVDLPTLDVDTLRALQSCENHAGTCVLTAAHAELPAVFQHGVNERFSAVVPRTGTAQNVLSIVRSDATVPDDERDLAALEPLLRATISALARLPGIVIRSLRRTSASELQLVVRDGRAFDRFHRELPRQWGWPSRVGVSKEAPPDTSAGRFGVVGQDQELFARRLAGSDVHAYLAILPWTDDDRLTIAIGISSGGAELVADLHAQAVREVPSFTLPKLEAREGVRHLLEYDWVVTKGYAGPDRRKEDTTVLNRYMMVGRRRELAPSLRDRVGGFVDGVPRWVGIAFASYLGLASIDALLTLRFVTAGAVSELNPLLAPLVSGHPWLFLLVKNVCALAAFGVVSRFHLFRRARLAVGGSVLMYALLDLYWMFLLFFFGA